MEDRVKINNGKSSTLQCPSDYSPSTFAEFLADLKAGDVYVDITQNNNLETDPGVTVVGTALNKANLLSDETATKIGVSDPKTPNNAMSVLQDNIDGVNNNVSALKTLRYATFSSGAWAGSSAPYTQTASVAGLLSTDNPSYDIHFDPTTTSASDALAMEVAFNCITKLVINAGSVTAYCFQNKPITSFSIVLKGE